MTAEDLDIIVSSVAPLMKEFVASKQQELLARIAEGEARIAQLEGRVAQVEAPSATKSAWPARVAQ